MTTHCLIVLERTALVVIDMIKWQVPREPSPIAAQHDVETLARAPSDLDEHLRGAGIESVLYTGVVTNGCVLLSLTAGFDLGYSGCVVSDATAAQTVELHDAALTVLSAFPAKVVDTEQTLLLLDAAVQKAAVG